MAKKSFIKAGWVPKIEAFGEREVAITFCGQNSKGTDCEVKAVIDKWEMVNMISRFKKVSKEWERMAIELNNQVTIAAQ